MKSTTYYPGGFIVGALQQNRASELDSVANTVTTWDTNGTQISQRVLNAAELAQVAIMDAQATSNTNGTALKAKAQTALDTNAAALALPDPTAANNTYLGHAAVPGGTLTLAQLSAIVRQLSDQLDATTRQSNVYAAQVTALTKQNNILIRLALGLLDTTTGTQ